MKWKTAAGWPLVLLFVFLLAACGAGSNGGTSSNDSGTGTLAVSLVDAPGPYKEVNVTIKEVHVCAAPVQGQGDGEDECEWQVVGTPNQTYNLLELVNGVMETLGQEDLPAGRYNQMRLLLDCSEGSNFLVDLDGETHNLKIPGGCRSGIKLVHPFDIAEDMHTELILDFDVARSVVQAGKSCKYLLKPTIKVIGTDEYVIVYGTARNDTGDAIEGASVAAWKDDVDSSGPTASTFSDITGGYLLYLDPGVYTMVATAKNAQPSCEKLEIYSDRNVDFGLTAIDKPTLVEIVGTVTLGTESDPPTVKISFLQVLACSADPVEVASKTFIGELMEPGVFGFWSPERDPDPIFLPAGSYFLKAETTDGQLTWGPESVRLDGSVALINNINF